MPCLCENGSRGADDIALPHVEPITWGGAL
jgi:hypothetical protein